MYTLTQTILTRMDDIWAYTISVGHFTFTFGLVDNGGPFQRVACSWSWSVFLSWEGGRSRTMGRTSPIV